jgi:hypothetical protein
LEPFSTARSVIENAHPSRHQSTRVGAAAGPATLTGALDSETLEALLHVVDERLRSRAMVNDGEVRERAAGLVGDPLPLPPRSALAELTAPYFNARTGGPLTRVAKRLLNLPLRVVVGPQAYFNDTLRSLLAGFDELLRALLESEAMLHRELARQRDTIDRLTAQVETLRAKCRAAGPLRVAIGAPASDWLTVGERTGPGITLVANAGRLPFRDGGIDELRVAGIVERVAPAALAADLLPAWRRMLRPGGLLRLVARNAHPLVPLLASAGFVDCCVTQLSAALPAMEVVAIRPPE